MTKEIIITAVGDNIKAQLKGTPIARAWGKSKNEAIGELIDQHREEFGISITYDRDDKNTRKYLEDSDLKTKKQNQKTEGTAIA